AGDARGRLKNQTRARARGDERRFGADHPRDLGARRRVQLVEVDELLRGLAHGLDHFGAQHRPAVARGRSRSVDDALDAEALVDAHHAAPSFFMARIAAPNAVTVSSMI